MKGGAVGAALAAVLAKRPLVGAAGLFTAGVCLGQTLPTIPGRAVLFACALVAILAAAASPRAPNLATLLALLCFLGSGAASASLLAAVSFIPEEGAEAVLEGVVAERPRLEHGQTRFLLNATHLERPGTWQPIKLSVSLSTTREEALLPGDRIRLRARLRPLEPPLNPGSTDLLGRYGARGIAATGYVVEHQLALLGEASTTSRIVARLRERYRRLVEDAVENREAGLLFRALALGDRAEMADEVQESFNKSGLAHILSVSGLHIAVVAAGLFKVLRWLLARSERLLIHANVRALASLCAIPATWLYVLATGAEIPAVRSGVMASALFLAMAVGRDHDAPSALGSALLAVLALDPSALRSISFQLSFSAVAGLILLTRPLRELVPLPRPDPRSRGFVAALLRLREALLQTAAGSLAASLATAPLVAMAFQRASLVAVLSNAVAMPVATGLTVFAASSALALPFADSAAALLVLAAAPLARALLWLSDVFASLPASSTRVAAPGLLVLFLWYLGLLGLSQLRARPLLAKRLLMASSALLLLIAAGSWMAPRLRRELKVTFLAVGQGDCALVQLPGGDNVLVDAGGDPAGHFDVGKRVVLPALIELGATRLHAVVLSHPHPDHGLGLVSVLQELDADELWIAGTASEGALLETLLQIAGERGMKVRRLSAGDLLERGSVRFETLHPSPTSILEGNDGSLVLRLSFGEVSFLLPGDVEGPAERLLAAAHLAPTTVLKVPHHGSRTSSSESFIRQLAPRHAVVSSGRNRFGFPHASVVERLRASGSTLHQTARDGAVAFSTDGSKLTVERFRESRLPLLTRVATLFGGVRSQELPR